jgi:hypothetical protein
VTKSPAFRAYTHLIKVIHVRGIQVQGKTKDNIGKYYHQHKLLQPGYEIGDEILLNRKNIQTV